LAWELHEHRRVKIFGLASIMSKINTNMAGVTTLYHLRNKEDAMNQALERISSGLRINNAVDDAAGASLVNRMTSQIKGLEAAIRNAADAVSLTQTAEGALDEVSSILHRMRELAVQAANGVYTGQDRQAIQNEVGQLQLELARIAENSTFNAVKMLNGDFTNTAFQIGFQPGDSAILSIENVDPTGLGEYLVKTDQQKNGSATFLPAAFPAVANTKAALTARVQETEDIQIFGSVGNVTIDINGGASAKEIAAAITARKGETGVYADAQTRMNISFTEQTQAALDAGTAKATDTVTFNLYGKNSEAVLIAANVDFGVVNGNSANLSELAAAINGTSGKTGITASLSVDKSAMTLISDDGYDIVMENYDLVGVTGPNMEVRGAAEDYSNLANSAGTAYDPVLLTAGTNPNSAGVTGEITFHSPFIFSVKSDSVGTAAAPTPTVETDSSDATEGTYLMTVPGTAGVTVTSAPAYTANSGGSGMVIEFKVDSSGGAVTPVRILNMGSGYSYQDRITIPTSIIGGSTAITLDLDNPSSATDVSTITNPGGLFSGNPSGASLSSVSSLDVNNVSSALKMLTAVDGALVRIDLERSDLGATMSRMEHTINNLSNIVVNTKAARSRIADADIAAESTELSKAQVLNQAAQAMLAQANKAQQSILQLLNG
jgi:flagellin